MDPILQFIIAHRRDQWGAQQTRDNALSRFPTMTQSQFNSALNRAYRQEQISVEASRASPTYTIDLLLQGNLAWRNEVTFPVRVSGVNPIAGPTQAVVWVTMTRGETVQDLFDRAAQIYTDRYPDVVPDDLEMDIIAGVFAGQP